MKQVLQMHIRKHYNFLFEVILKPNDFCFGIIET